MSQGIRQRQRCTETATANGNGETATEERQRNGGNQALWLEQQHEELCFINPRGLTGFSRSSDDDTAAGKLSVDGCVRDCCSDCDQDQGRRDRREATSYSPAAG